MIRSTLLVSMIGLLSLSAAAKDYLAIQQSVLVDIEEAVAHKGIVGFQKRDQWGAMEITDERAKSCDLQGDLKKKVIVVLSTMSSENTHGAECPQTVENAYVRRQDATFCGIGTNFVIDDTGTVFQGRELQHKAACSVPNTGVIGITLCGDFVDNGSSFESEMQYSLSSLIAILGHSYDIEINKENILAMSKRSNGAAKFRTSPGSVVTRKFEEILEGAKHARCKFYDEDCASADL